MTGKSKRLVVFAVLAVLISGGVWLVLSALQDNIVLFYAPSELSEADKTGTFPANNCATTEFVPKLSFE